MSSTDCGKWHLWFGLVVGSLALAPVTVMADEAMAANADSADGDSTTVPPTVAEVIVTARKTPERMEDVPIAMSVVDSGVLREANHFRIQDVNELMPNVNNNVVNGHQSSFAIRGLGNNPGNDGLEYSAGVFLDGVYLGRPGMASVDLIDISQIEVLRGPQGTLFGKNTTAGAVNITTAAPSFTFNEQGQATYGNHNYQQYQGSVSGPIVEDTLAARLTAYGTHRDGTIYDVTTNQDVNTIDREGVRAQLLFQPASSLSIRLIADYATENNQGVTTFNNLGLTPAAINSKLAATGGRIAVDPNGLTTAVDGPLYTNTRQYGFSSEINWKVGGFKATSITAYRHWRYSSLTDTDGSSADFFNGGYDVPDSQWSQELRLAFPSLGPVDLVTGAYYFEQQVDSEQIIQYGSQSAAWLTGIPDAKLPAIAATTPSVATLLNYNGSRWQTYATPQTHSYALFGQAVWHATDRWNLTAGLRETYETKEESVWRDTPLVTATGQPNAALASLAVAPFSVGIHNTSPSALLSTDYHLAPGLMAYAFVSHGEKAGGTSASLPAAGHGPDSLKVKPEKATDYEAGVKSELLGRKLTVNAGVFYTDVHDYQANYYGTVNNTTVSILSNVGQVLTRGAELEAAALPLTGLTLHASVGYDRANYGQYPNGPCPQEVTGRIICDLSGRPIVGAPEWTANVYGGYQHPINSLLVGYGRAEYSWRSRYYGYQDDSALTITGDYGLLNLYAGIRTATGHWDLMLWGKNVADKHYVGSFTNLGSLVPGAYLPQFGDPATYGVTLRVTF